MIYQPEHHELDSTYRVIVDEQLRLREAARAIVPGVDAPYFAHMRIQSGGRTRDVLLGRRTARGGGVLVIDWQSAPLAAVFFEHTEGEEYELELEHGTLSGVLVQRNLLGFERGELVEIATSNATLSRRSTGEWAVSRSSPPAAIIRPRPERTRRQRTSPAQVELDPAQMRAVTRPRHAPVLVLGEAGCGKTTVALHRLAYLARQAASKGQRFRAAVIVPSEGLRRFTEALVDRLDLGPDTGRIEVWLYDRWAAEQARATFKGLPRRESRDASAAVIQLKRHSALRAALASVPEHRAQSGRGAHARRGDLLHLFGDRALLERVREQAAGALSARMVDEVLAHTRVQFSRTTEEEHAHVDADRLVTVDGRAIDDGTPTQDAGTIDVEDYAVLFELDRVRSPNAPAPLPRLYECIVVDEAQELAPLELALLGRALLPGGSLIVAGDHAQQVDPSACFVDWQTTMTELGAREHETVTLDVSYRCPPEVTALARPLREAHEPAAPAHAPAAPEGAASAVAHLRFDNECHLAATLIDALRELRAHDPWATIAIICHTPAAARRMAGLLGRGLDVHLALDGDFLFDAGINVTCVPEVKGLEFDYVIVPDASSAVYPDNAAARHALYVATTRTVHQLVLAAVGSPTPLLPRPDA